MDGFIIALKLSNIEKGTIEADSEQSQRRMTVRRRLKLTKDNGADAPLEPSTVAMRSKRNINTKQRGHEQTQITPRPQPVV